MRMKLRKKYIVWSLSALVIVGIVGYSVYSSQNKKVTYTTVVAKRADVTQTVEATGSVASAQELSLSFKRDGRIQSVTTTVGAAVKQGQILATIGDPASISQLDRARGALLAAQADLEKLNAGAKPGDIAISNQKIASAQVDVDSATSSLNNAIADQTKTKQVYSDAAFLSLSDSTFAVEYTLDYIYDNLLDAQANSYFDTTKTTALTTTQTQYGAARAAIATAKVSTSIAVASHSEFDILKALQNMRSALDATQIDIDAAFEAVSGAIVNSNYSQTTIDGFKTSLNTRSASISNEKSSIQTSLTNFSTGLQALQTVVDIAAYKQKAAIEALHLAEAQLQATTASPQPYEIKQQQARVLQAEADVRAAAAVVGDSVISAPVDGIVTAVDKKVGESASPNVSVIKMIGVSKLQIDVDIPESDINKISLGQKTAITLDAFGPDKAFSGTVSFIEPSQRIIQDVVYYRVTVVFDATDQPVKPGMTATIKIVAAAHTGVIVIPLRTVVTASDGVKSIQVLHADGTVATSTIALGIRGDDGNVEVTSGVSEGAQVVTGTSK